MLFSLVFSGTHPVNLRSAGSLLLSSEEPFIFFIANHSLLIYLPFPFRFFLAFEDETKEFGGGLGGGAALFNKE